MTKTTAILIAWLVSSGFVIEVISIFNDGFAWNDQTIEIQIGSDLNTLGCDNDKWTIQFGIGRS